MAVDGTAKLEAGAIVELKSGEPPMTVRKISGNLAECEWFKEAILKKATFELHSLKLAAVQRTHEEWLYELSQMEHSGK
jgi:uncharacterized protein YodC (DUF2158 family)